MYIYSSYGKKQGWDFPTYVTSLPQHPPPSISSLNECGFEAQKVDEENEALQRIGFLEGGGFG